MPQQPQALLRGRVSLRPWRVAPLVDLDSADEVLGAVRDLTKVWGGRFLPILDSNADLTTLRSSARMHDLDSLYAHLSSEELDEILRIPGYNWRGRGEWGPFSDTEIGLRKGLLGVESVSAPAAERPHRRVPRDQNLTWHAYAGWGASVDTDARPIELTEAGLVPSISYVDPLPRGLFVVRPDTPRDVAWFWSCRSMGGECYPFEVGDSILNEIVLSDLDRQGVPTPPAPTPHERPTPTLTVWGGTDLTVSQIDNLKSWGATHDVNVEMRPRHNAMAGAWFPGFRDIATRSFRKDADPGRPSVSIELPRLPFENLGLLPGIIAAEVDFHQASGLDPRLTAALPPHRRHARLLEPALASRVDHVRVSSVGPVFGVQAGADELIVPLANNLEVMRLLFDEPATKTTQSDEGKFQSRVAEMFGGATSGALTQPGTRAAIERVAERSAGVTLHELNSVIQRDRGGWPDRIYSSRLSSDEYVAGESRRLLNSGLLIPLLDLQCSFCRVVSRVHPSDLGTTVRCEFCNEDFTLALSLALAKPTWRYRLAGHLPAERVRAMLPAVASLSVLSALHVTEGPDMSHVLGLEVATADHRPIEVDVAAIMRGDDWTVVLGEVKNHHAIDDNDVSNLAHLQELLLGKETPTILMFATLRSSFTTDERARFRNLVETTTRVVERFGSRWPIMPLLFTKEDLSVPWGDESHPWRWNKVGQGGIFGTAIESCRKHIGLQEFDMSAIPPIFTWD